MNSICLEGRLGRDAELKRSAAGNAYCKVSLGVKRESHREGDPDIDWFEVLAFGKHAEETLNGLGKGSTIRVEGRVQINDWIANDGEKRRSVEVICSNVQLVERKASWSRPTAQPPKTSVADIVEGVFGDTDEFDPFGQA